MASLTASANVRGRAIDLSLAWSDPFGQPRSLRVLRRRWGYPTGPADGLAVLDLGDLFSPTTAPWARIDAGRFLLLNDRAEGGVLQAELAQYYAGAADAQPGQVRVQVYDPQAPVNAVISPVSRVTSAVGSVPGYGATTVFTIYALPAAGPEVLAGTLVVSTQGPSVGLVPSSKDYTQLDADSDVAPASVPTPLAPSDLLQWTPATQTVTAATLSAPIAITTANAHWLSSGAAVVIAGVAGNTAANGTWSVIVTGPTTFTLTGSTGNAAYTGHGTAAPVTMAVPFLRQEARSTAATVRQSAPLDVSFVTTMVGAAGPVPTCKVEFTDAQNPDTGDLGRAVVIADREPPTRTDAGFDPGLLPGRTYYYTAFEDTGSGLAAGTTWSASAVATGRYGFAEKLFALLPAVHRYYDDPASGQGGSWQLRRFLEVFGPGLDQARSLGDGLATLHDIFEVRADFLPYLARLIGWAPDATLPTARQRNDVLLAPEVYATVGTVPNVKAMVNRATGWGCQVQEFVNNVFLTNAVEPIQRWEIWEADAASGAFDPAHPPLPTVDTPASNESIDGRPAVVADPGGGAPWLFWHSNRDPAYVTATAPTAPVQRRIWMTRADGATTPILVVPDTGSLGDQCPAAVADVIAGVNVIRLFWSSTREGRPNLWTLTLTKAGTGWTAGAPEQLTDHPAGDDFPAAVIAGGNVWLFWQSSRRGPTDIWAMTLAAGTTGAWSPPQRITGTQQITGGEPRRLTPSAMVDTTQAPPVLNLFWSADFGDHSRIYRSSYNPGSPPSWSPPVDFSTSLFPSVPAPVSPFYRDEAPAAAVSAGSLWVFWHSDRDGLPHVYATRQTGTTWSAAFPVSVGRSAEKEPAPFVASAAGPLRLFFRTQRGGEIYRSRTVDMSRLDEVAQGMAGDRWHYTYSTDISSTAYYARDAVGLYLKPDETGTDTDHQSELSRVQALVEPFRPVPARFLWILEPVVDSEAVYSPLADIGESYTDNFPYVETLGAVVDSATVTTGWVVLMTNTLADVTATPTNLKNRVFFPAPT